ncbi:MULTISPECIES: hypothetical protein [Aliiglaciecola]|nr:MULTISPECIES: hypothetical protein [Aliiglaciecola]MBU2879392.1 hypothetical protein [Aliiglaciecola lipolytica]MDO6712434.1 hypothetical protein [Aliiglaciecola sp. 2_MG-2023]MDO6753508.1 hypothetical protein [Aliiglaciecola sp. 1_MG-2023]
MGVESVVFSFAEALSDGTGSMDAALEIATGVRLVSLGTQFRPAARQPL